jgi:hypothetical protein
MGIYKPPSVNDADFSEKFSKNIDKIIVVAIYKIRQLLNI